MQNHQRHDEYTGGPSAPPGQAPVRDRDGRRRDLPYKVPFLAGFLSGILPGLGQIYVGYYQVGMVLAATFAGVITLLSSGEIDGLEPFFAIMLGFVWLYGIIDGARRAQAVNLALDGHGEEPLPSNLTLPAVGGSRTGGLILVVLGVILVLRTGFDLRLDWLEDWWPLLLVALGVWLLYRSRQETARADGGGVDRGGADAGAGDRGDPAA